MKIAEKINLGCVDIYTYAYISLSLYIYRLFNLIISFTRIEIDREIRH